MTMTNAKRRLSSATGDVRDRVGPAAESTGDVLGRALGEAKDRLGPAIGELRDRIGPVVEDTRDRLAPALEDARGRLVPALGEARERIAPVVGDARDKVAPLVGDARDRVAPILGDARDRIVPALGDARERITPVLDDARERIVPALGEARGRLAPVAQYAVAESRRRGRTAAVRLHLLEEPKPSHKLRNALALIGLAAAVAFVYKRFFHQQEEWSAAAAPVSPAKSPSPAQGVNSTGSDPVSDTGAGSPNGRPAVAPSAPLTSEESVAAPEPTTPDEPLEVTNVEEATPSDPS